MFNFVQPSALPVPRHVAPQNPHLVAGSPRSPNPAPTGLRLRDPPFWMFPVQDLRAGACQSDPPTRQPPSSDG
ncbi:hypothetical protein MDA_GLEAN10011283 [Myotis davidii]|uniref:Uncharacterized protein n=1 Tax=Myotis davidii TaxID=225400 RepID=L5MDC5_MYODS|nr:hypothetical protein MDA_GLEAN10011283 [Myotis davidii]